MKFLLNHHNFSKKISSLSYKTEILARGSAVPFNLKLPIKLRAPALSESKKSFSISKSVSSMKEFLVVGSGIDALVTSLAIARQSSSQSSSTSSSSPAQIGVSLLSDQIHTHSQNPLASYSAYQGDWHPESMLFLPPNATAILSKLGLKQKLLAQGQVFMFLFLGLGSNPNRANLISALSLSLPPSITYLQEKHWQATRFKVISESRILITTSRTTSIPSS